MDDLHYPYEHGPRAQPDDGRRTPPHGDPLAAEALRHTAASDALDAELALEAELAELDDLEAHVRGWRLA